MYKLNKILASIALIFISIGLIGFFSPLESMFKSLSSYNLLLTFILVLISFKNDLKNFSTLLLITFTIGFISEQIGVHTGYLFGNYSYSDNLGLKIYGVPIIIGINWAILSIGSWNLCKNITKLKIVNILIASLLMTTFDFVMEPTAIDLDYWKWENGIIPIYNYISWFLVSISVIFFCSLFQKKYSGITKIVFVSQFLFFIILSSKIIWF
jgi:putative membrane protein